MLSSARASSLLLLRAGGASLGAWRGARRYVAPAVLSALGEYGARHGHVRVPQKFVVPHRDGWTAEARGLKLGVQVMTLRKKRQKGMLSHSDAAELDALGFVWSIRQWQWERVQRSLAKKKAKSAGGKVKGQAKGVKSKQNRENREVVRDSSGW